MYKSVCTVCTHASEKRYGLAKGRKAVGDEKETRLLEEENAIS